MHHAEEEPQGISKVLACVDNLIFPYCDRLLKNSMFENLMAFITIYSLFGEDLKAATSPGNAADPTFVVLTSISFFLFLFEFCLQNYAKKEYRLGFYFVLDFVSTASL